MSAKASVHKYNFGRSRWGRYFSVGTEHTRTALSLPFPVFSHTLAYGELQLRLPGECVCQGLGALDDYQLNERYVKCRYFGRSSRTHTHTHTPVHCSDGNKKVTKKGYKAQAKTKGIKMSEITSVCCGTHTLTYIHTHAHHRPLGSTLSDG